MGGPPSTRVRRVPVARFGESPPMQLLSWLVSRLYLLLIQIVKTSILVPDIL